RDFDDVLVFGQHLPLLAVGTLAGDICLELAIEGREIDIQARAYRLMVFTQAQHHGLLLLVDDIDRIRQPHSKQQHQTNPDQRKTAAPASTARRRAATTFFAAEHAIEAVLQLTESLIQI